MGSISPSKNGESKTSFEDLAPETAIETLLRVPVKTLITSTSVSKTWYSLIRTPNFVSAQIRHSISCCDENAVLVIPADISSSEKKYCSLISAETGSVIDKYDIPFNSSTGSVRFIGSVNGVLCLSKKCMSDASQEVYMWNPSVRKYKSLVVSCHHDRCILGFGFHEPTQDYRVVRIKYRFDNNGNCCGKLAPKIEVFSLQMNGWRNIENPIVPRAARGSGTTVNSSVYWVDHRYPQTYLEEVWILYFDFNKEVFGQVKLSDDVRYCLGGAAIFHLMKFEDSLSVCVYKRSGSNDPSEFSQTCCIWLMTHNDGIISWTMRFKVVLKESGFPFSITKNGALILISVFPKSPDTSIMSCDLKSMRYKSFEFVMPLGKLPIVPAWVDNSFIESLAMQAGRDEEFESAKSPFIDPSASASTAVICRQDC